MWPKKKKMSYRGANMEEVNIHICPCINCFVQRIILGLLFFVQFVPQIKTGAKKKLPKISNSR